MSFVRASAVLARRGPILPTHGLRAHGVTNVLLQIATCADEETFFVALKSALRKSLLPPGGMVRLSARLAADLRWMLGFARTDADSGLESLIRLRLHRLGIAVRTQVLIDGVGEVDLVIGDRLILEADGKENHDDDPAAPAPTPASRRHKDLMRDAKAAALGYETLRFDYAMIVHDWPTVAAAIVEKVRASAHLRARPPLRRAESQTRTDRHGVSAPNPSPTCRHHQRASGMRHARPSYSASIRSRTSRRSTLPMSDRGRSSTTMMRRGTL